MKDVVERIDAWLEGDFSDDADKTLRDARTEIIRLRAQMEMLRDEVADAKKWAMQERSLRWHNLAANDATGSGEGREVK